MPETAVEARPAAKDETAPAPEATTEAAAAEAAPEAAAAEATTESAAAKAAAETTATEAAAVKSATAAAAESAATAVSTALRKGVAGNRCDRQRCRERQRGYCFTDHGHFLC
jgi:hypothetical protein